MTTQTQLNEAVRAALKESNIKAHNPDRFKNLMAAFIIGSFVGVLPLFIFWGIPTTSKEIVTYMVGQLSGMATTILGAYFVNNVGKEKQDAKQAENQGKMAGALIATANSTPISQSASQGAEAVANAAVNKADEIKDNPNVSGNISG